MKNYGGDDNSNRNRNSVQFTIGDRVTYHSRNHRIREGTVYAVYYEIMDEHGILHRRNSSQVMPPQNPQGVQQDSTDVASHFTAAPNTAKKVDHIPLFRSVELLKGPYAGLQGILADVRTSHLTVVVGVDGEMKTVPVGRWEDMKVVDRPPEYLTPTSRNFDDKPFSFGIMK